MTIRLLSYAGLYYVQGQREDETKMTFGVFYDRRSAVALARRLRKEWATTHPKVQTTER